MRDPAPGPAALVESFGARIAITAPAPALDEVRASLEGCGTWQSPVDDGRGAACDAHLDFDDAVARGGPVGAGRRLASDVHHAIAAHARDALFIHAGTVGCDGIAVLLPGSSMAGKSTLVHALVAQGATYCSDEFAVLDDEGRVHPYPKPISLRAGDGPARLVPAGRIGKVARTPLEVGLVVSTWFDPAGGGPPWEPVIGARAALGLVEHTVLARSEATRMLDIVAQLAGRASFMAGPRGEAADAAREIIRLAREGAEGGCPPAR